VNENALKLTVYFGESDHVDGHRVSDRLHDCYHRHELRSAILLRGLEGFGVKHQLHTQRLLTLSEDLPLVSIAVDTRERVERAVEEVAGLLPAGLCTLERARLLSGQLGEVRLPEELHEATKLTVYLGRSEQIDGRPLFVALVELLRNHGLAGATALLGVDGMAHGERQRARFFARNTDVPLMVISVGPGEAIARALPAIGELVPRPLLTLERVRLCKRHGRRLAEPRHLPEHDDAGLAVWQKLMVYADEQAHHAGRPLYVELVRRLRAAGAAGATSVRGIWGFSGEEEPHGDRLFALRRRVPVVTSLIDRPERIQQWWRIVDELTDETGLVTSELVPALQAISPQRVSGGLRLSRLHL
jgi:PII-like signaling protein